MKIIGIDVGTTTVCGAALDADSGTLLRAITLANDSALPVRPFERLQDPRRIFEICKKLYGALLAEFPDAAAVGLTGQMHGMLYLDGKGEPLSPLYTWQDERGERLFARGESYAQALTRTTGRRMASGYGLTTLFYNEINRLTPAGAAKICTIHDFVAMKLCGAFAPVAHVSDAASFGLFDLENFCFDLGAAERADLPVSFLPETACGLKIIGRTAENVAVCVAVGDNQASVLASVTKDSALVNVGTGSQVSVVSDCYLPESGAEFRPYFEGKYLMTGSSLAGGYAYSLLRDFFAETLKMFSLSLPDDAYERMNGGAREAMRAPRKVECAPCFCGTRENPALRASYANIGAQEFTPQQFALATLSGICEELYRAFRRFPLERAPQTLVGSGNGIRKNALLAQLVAERFSLPLLIPLYEEEAAVGAALCALSALENTPLSDLSNMIRYRGER